MAGPSIGTWVKVRNKSGRTTARVIPNNLGGGSYQQGEVITQSEFKKVQEKRADMKEARRDPIGDRRQARQSRISEIKQGIGRASSEQADKIFGKGNKGITEKSIARFERTKAAKRGAKLARMEGAQQAANQAALSSGSGNRAKRRAAEARGETVPRYKSFEQARQGFQRQEKVANRRITKAALSKDKKREIMDRNVEGMIGKQIRNQDQARIKQNRLDRKKREVRRKYNPDAPAFARARKAAETRKGRK